MALGQPFAFPMSIDVVVILIQDSSRHAPMRFEGVVFSNQGSSCHATKPPLQLARAGPPRLESQPPRANEYLMSLDVWKR